MHSSAVDPSGCNSGAGGGAWWSRRSSASLKDLQNKTMGFSSDGCTVLFNGQRLLHGKIVHIKEHRLMLCQRETSISVVTEQCQRVPLQLEVLSNLRLGPSVPPWLHDKVQGNRCETTKPKSDLQPMGVSVILLFLFGF